MSKNSDEERSKTNEHMTEVFARFLTKRPLTHRSVLEIVRLGEKNWNNLPKQKKKEHILKQTRPKEREVRPVENPYAYEECDEYECVESEIAPDIPKTDSNICTECHKNRKRKKPSEPKKTRKSNPKKRKVD